LDLKDAIIIFDEAHNIEDISETSMSYELSTESFEFTQKLKQKDVYV